MDTKLYVSRVASLTTAQDLRTLFAQAGAVVSVQLLGQSDDLTAPRSAHVTMATRAAAQKAIDLFHQMELAGRPLSVSFAPVRGGGVSAPGQLSAFGGAPRTGAAKTRSPGQRGGYQSSLGAFGSSPSAPTPPRRRGGSQHR